MNVRILMDKAHAAQRMRERLGCSDSKMSKLAYKAWASKEPVSSAEVNVSRQNGAVYRKLMGMIFVFIPTSYGAMLTTCMPPCTGARKFQSKERDNKRFLSEIFRGIEPGS